MPNIQDFHMNQVLVKSKEGVAITFYVNDDQEMRHWTEEIDAQAKLYTESKRKYAGTGILSSLTDDRTSK